MARTKRKWAVVAGTLLAVWTAILAVRAIQAHRTYPGLAGVWEGTYFKQSVALKIARTKGTYFATFDYIDSGLDIPASNLKPGKNAISFCIVGTTERFMATINPGMTAMSGNWREGTNSYPLTLKRIDRPDIVEPLTEADYALRAGSDLQGFWRGIIKSGGWQFGANLKIAEPTPGKFRAELDGVDWGGQHIPAI